MNFFGWVRDGVRQAVLLGVNDAVDSLGKPHEDDDFSVRMLDVIRDGGTDAPGKLPAARNRRKKLGRSLSDIQTSAAAAKSS